ncbi:MAG: metallophosphoesterase family protein [Sciscionella sp.]
MQNSAPSVYVIGDVHGHRRELAAALRTAGLVDCGAHWSGGDSVLVFLGDFVDRGPEGVAVIELVMRLSEEAAEAGGRITALLGNHEILALGMYLFGEQEVPSDFGPRSFARSWRLNGGLEADQEAMTTDQVAWLSALPALALEADHLLMHSDTVEYFGWGETIAEINEGVRAVLQGSDIRAWWDCWRRMTTRYAFRGEYGQRLAEEVLGRLGGNMIVHGHSVIAEALGVAAEDVHEPLYYAGDKVVDVDGGLFIGGPCLIVRLGDHRLVSARH